MKAESEDIQFSKMADRKLRYNILSEPGVNQLREKATVEDPHWDLANTEDDFFKICSHAKLIIYKFPMSLAYNLKIENSIY